MAGREYDASQASMMSNMRLSFSADGTAVYNPIIPPAISPPSPTAAYQPGDGGNNGDDSSAAAVMSAGTSGDGVNRRRGRPRKYAPDGSMPTSGAGLTSPAAAEQSGGFSSPAPVGGGAALSTGKKARGRPPGSVNKKRHPGSDSAGVGFTPHIISVQAGEDVLAKLVSFSQNSSRAVCVLSANGAISNVTLRQPATLGGTVTYEGRFEILSLSGSFLLSESGAQRSRTGGLSVSLAGPDGRVLGGGVAGLLTAASPVQVIVGSFMTASQKQSKRIKSEVLTGPTKLGSGTSGGGSMSESSGGPGSPLNPSNSSNPQGMASISWR